MKLRRPFERAAVLSRLIVSSCCAVAVLSGAAFAQQFAPPTESDALDARLTRFLSGDDSSVAAPLPAQTSGTRFVRPSVAPQAPAAQPIKPTAPVEPSSAAKSPIRQTSATFQSVKPSPVRQTQYAEASSAPAIAQRTNAQASPEKYVDECPDPRDMPSILDVPYKVVVSGTDFPESCPLPDEDYIRKAPTPITFTWKASSLCYKPLYFEDVQLERYGHYCHPLVAPFASRARFWLTIPVLPYLMGVNPPNECVYDLGYYRPGDCAPSMLQPIPISLRGGLMQAGAVVGAAALIP